MGRGEYQLSTRLLSGGGDDLLDERIERAVERWAKEVAGAEPERRWDALVYIRPLADHDATQAISDDSPIVASVQDPTEGEYRFDGYLVVAAIVGGQDSEEWLGWLADRRNEESLRQMRAAAKLRAERRTREFRLDELLAPARAEVERERAHILETGQLLYPTLRDLSLAAGLDGRTASEYSDYLDVAYRYKCGHLTRRLTPKRKAAALAALERGLSRIQVAALCGLGQGQVYYVERLRRQGL